nr:hypothetical protein [Tanacetum cinerariifolium]
MDADDQAIQTILLGLPEDVYAAEKKAKLFNEWEKFTSTDGESIESYYYRFMQLMNDLKRNKHFPENIASNLKFLNNLQPEWKRYVVRQTKNLHEADFTQIYDFIKMNQEEVNELRAERLAKSHDPLAHMAHSQNSFNFPITHKDQSSFSTHPQQSFPINNKYNPQPPLNQNFMQPPMTSLEDINDPTEAMNAALILFAKAFQLSAPTNNNQRTSSNPRNRQIAQPIMNMVAQNQQGFNAWKNGGIQVAQNASVQSGGNQNGLVVVPGIANQNGTGNVVAARDEGLEIEIKPGDLDENEEVNANFILMVNLQQASTSSTQHDMAPVYDTDGSAKFLGTVRFRNDHIAAILGYGKSKRASHPPKPVPNSMQRLHLLHMDLCCPMRVASINDFVHLQATVIIVRTDNGMELKNQVLKEYFDSVGITHETAAAKTPQQNGVVEHRNHTLVEAARIMLIFSHAPLFLWAEGIATACYTQTRSIIPRRFNKTPYELIQGKKPNISYLHVFGALFYPKNDHEHISKLGAKGDIGFFIGYSANSVAYRVYNQRTRKIMETMNVMFDELSAMVFEQNSSRLGLQSMTYGQISSELKLTYAPSTIIPQRPSKHDLDILF